MKKQIIYNFPIKHKREPYVDTYFQIKREPYNLTHINNEGIHVICLEKLVCRDQYVAAD